MKYKIDFGNFNLISANILSVAEKALLVRKKEILVAVVKCTLQRIQRMAFNYKYSI
jgi:hypothetical protein